MSLQCKAVTNGKWSVHFKQFSDHITKVYRCIRKLTILYFHPSEKTRWFLGKSGSVAKWFVRWATKLATRVRSRVAVGLPTGYSVLVVNLTEYCLPAVSA